MRIEISREEVLLDTGGGLKNASWFFLDDPSRLDEPFILHNVDVLSAIDLRRMVEFHTKNRALATLAVKDRKTSRYLLFDEQDLLCGRRSNPDQKTELVRPAKTLQALGFSGIHVISPRLLPMMTEEGVFSIINSYLNLASRGQKILAFHADEYIWHDLGRPENLIQAEADLKTI
jgi:NDP-sugar pyrophosphorylase family protein